MDMVTIQTRDETFRLPCVVPDFPGARAAANWMASLATSTEGTRTYFIGLEPDGPRYYEIYDGGGWRISVHFDADDKITDVHAKNGRDVRWMVHSKRDD